jgi:DNA polymerase-3 subunit delta'
MLPLWQLYWRDVVLLASGGDVPVVNVDRLDALRALAARVGVDAAGAALEAVRETANRLTLNANTRLATEVLALDLPGYG